MAHATASARIKRNFFVQHLLGAVRFSAKVGELETDNAGKPFGPFFEEIVAYANACVLLSAAALESYANEVYLEPATYFPELAPTAVEKVWPKIERLPILDKFQLALALRSKPLMAEGTKPFQQAKLIVELRNAITHFKPEWHDENGKHAKLSKKLTSALGKGNVYFQGEPLFPVRWMTHPNTKWVVIATIKFVKTFEAAANAKLKMDYAKLNP